MSTISLKKLPPAYQIAPAPQPKNPPTLRRVLWNKFLAYIQASTGAQLLRASLRLCTLVLIAGLLLDASLTIAALRRALTWRDGVIPMYVLVAYAVLHIRSLWKMARKLYKRRGGEGNQHTFEGIPRDEVITFLFKNGHFKREQSMSHFEISQPRYQKIAKILEKHDVLVRGENNALVLNPDLSREELGTQLRENFPLRFNHELKRWSAADTQFYRSETRRDDQLREYEHKYSRANSRLRKILARKEREEEQAGIMQNPFIVRELVQ